MVGKGLEGCVDDRIGDAPFVLVKAQALVAALPSASIIALAALPPESDVPDTPAFARGVVVMRGRTLPLIDLRRRLGMPSLADEVETLAQLLDAREEDHRRWVAELEASVRERRPFTLTTDPHKCAFGRWYDSLRTDHLVLESQLKKIDGPHKALHAHGAEVVALMAKRDTDAAEALIATVHAGVFAEIRTLLADTRTMLRDSGREVALVVETGRATVALAVDQVESVETLERAESHRIDRVLPGMGDRLVTDVAMRRGDRQLVMVLDPGRLMAA